MAMLMPLNDRCYIGTHGAPSNGEPRAAYTYDTGTAVRCAVMSQTPKSDTAGIQLPMDAVRIAFRRDSGVTDSTRVQVYRRLRQTLGTAEYYEVQGAPKIVRGRLVAVCQRTSARGAL